MGSFEDRQKSMGERIGKLESKSGKRWDSIVEKAITAIVTAFIVYALSKIGM
jgi:hypothetical protein